MATDKQGTLAGVLAGLAAAGLGLATAFGIHISSQEHAAVLTFCGAVALAAPLAGSIFDHSKAQVASRQAATSSTTPSQADIIQAQIDALTAQKAALPK